MTESLLKDIIDEALEERITDKVEFIKENEARKMADREFMLSVDNRWGDEGFLRCNTFFNVQEGVKKKAFTNLFDETFQSIYDQAYDITMESILMSDLFWNDRKVDEFYHLREMDRQFSIALEVEMEKSSKSIIKKISEMIDDDLNDAVEERFESFKKDIAAKTKGHSKKRRKWAIDKLEKIKEKFERLDWNDENSSIIRNAEAEIEDFYSQFDIETNIVEEQAKDMEIGAYCFQKD